MAAPTAYTETTLKTYMDAELGPWADVFVTAWEVANGDYDEPVNEALLDMNTQDISTVAGIANIQKLRILARLHMWRKVLGQIGTRYDTETDGEKLKRDQLSKHAKGQVEELEKFGYSQDPGVADLKGGVITVQEADYSAGDPYSNKPKDIT